MVRDPVCGMEIDPNTAPESMEYKGETYHFCSSDCRETFEQNPERYIHAKAGQRGTGQTGGFGGGTSGTQGGQYGGREGRGI